MNHATLSAMLVGDEGGVGVFMDVDTIEKEQTEVSSKIPLTKEIVVARIKDFQNHLEKVIGWPSGMNSHRQKAIELSNVVLEGLTRDYLTPDQAHELTLAASLSLADHLKRQRGHRNKQEQGE